MNKLFARSAAVSVETAVRIWKLGLDVESTWYWADVDPMITDLSFEYSLIAEKRYANDIPAPSADDIVRFLPHDLTFRYDKWKKLWECRTAITIDEQGHTHCAQGDSIHEAAGEMLIMLEMYARNLVK
jgi:hypothetical protein